MKLKVVGQRKPLTKKKITKADVRKQMFEHMTKRAGVPLSCKDMGEIVSKLSTGKKGAKAACGHDHGQLELAAVEDDAEFVEVIIPAHIAVKEIAIVEGGER